MNAFARRHRWLVLVGIVILCMLSALVTTGAVSYQHHMERTAICARISHCDGYPHPLETFLAGTQTASQQNVRNTATAVAASASATPLPFLSSRTAFAQNVRKTATAAATASLTLPPFISSLTAFAQNLRKTETAAAALTYSVNSRQREMTETYAYAGTYIISDNFSTEIAASVTSIAIDYWATETAAAAVSASFTPRP